MLHEAAAAIVARPGRTALTALGTVVGVAAFVATVGIAQTASSQVSARFDALKATQITATDLHPDAADPPFPADTTERLADLNGVVAAGELWTVAERIPVRPLVPPDPGNPPPDLPVLAATPGALRAMNAEVRAGRLFDSFHEQRAEHVALLGSGAAARLGISDVSALPAVAVGDAVYTVIGILADAPRRPEALLGVILPAGTATRTLPPSANAHEVLVEVAPGAAGLIAEQLPLALRPQEPERYFVSAPPDPATLRESIESDLTSLFLALAGVALVIGTIGIANTTLVAVMERTNELGLRRALGARPRHIAVHILTEAALTGTLSGLLGATVGILALLAVAVANTWTAVLDPALAATAPAIGALTGIAAGAYPAYRATRIQPVEALRQ